MKNIFKHQVSQKLIAWSLTHKVWASIALLAVLLSGYGLYRTYFGSSTIPSYVVANVKKATVIATVTGSGQVSASSQISLKAKAGGNIIYVGAQSGQVIKAGTLLFEVDPRDAALDLANARVSLAKLEKPTDQATLIQGQNDLTSAVQAKDQAYTSLVKSYDDGLNKVAGTFVDLATVMTGLGNIVNNPHQTPYFANNLLGTSADTYRDTAIRNYGQAKIRYDQALINYRAFNRNNSSSSTIEAIIDESYETTQLVSQAVKDTYSAVTYIHDQSDATSQTAQMSTDISSLNTWTSLTNAHLLDLKTITSTIQASHDTINSASLSVPAKQAALAKLEQGSEPLDIESARLALQQKQNAYDDYFTRAPFDGLMGNVSVNKLDEVSGGTVLGIFISTNKLAQISLNEVDAAKIKVGQKVTLSFDAIDGLSISGQVVEVDQVGTVTQGVVTYNVKIGFDTQDDRVRPGMSVNAAIITNVKQDVLTVPNSAVKNKNGQNYVEVFNPALSGTASGNQGISSPRTPLTQNVTIGIADDSATEIVSGLQENDQVVVRTITSSATSGTAAPNIFGAATGRSNTGAIRGATGGR